MCLNTHLVFFLAAAGCVFLFKSGRQMFVYIKRADVPSCSVHPLSVPSVLSRWEMQEGAELDDGEKAMVEDLKKAFLVCCCSAGPRDPPDAEDTQAEQIQRETQPSDESAAQ